MWSSSSQQVITSLKSTTSRATTSQVYHKQSQSFCSWCNLQSLFPLVYLEHCRRAHPLWIATHGSLDPSAKCRVSPWDKSRNKNSFLLSISATCIFNDPSQIHEIQRRQQAMTSTNSGGTANERKANILRFTAGCTLSFATEIECWY